jgi:hypothetical protein
MILMNLGNRAAFDAVGHLHEVMTCHSHTNTHPTLDTDATRHGRSTRICNGIYLDEMVQIEVSIDKQDLVLCQLTRAERICHGIIIFIHIIRHDWFSADN